MAVLRRAGPHKKCALFRAPNVLLRSHTKGLPQHIQLRFSAKIIPQKLGLTFQGGFVGTRCVLHTSIENSDWQRWTEIYPEDVNRQQWFDLEGHPDGVNGLQIVFEESSDFFGRITVYDLQIRGRKLNV